MKTARSLWILAMLLAPAIVWAQVGTGSAEASPPAEEGSVSAEVDPQDPPPAATPAPPEPGRPGQAPRAPHVMTQRRIVRFRGPEALGYGPMGGHEFGMGLGAWWKNSKIVSQLGLNDDQVKKISQTFLDHRLKLVDLRADLEKQEIRLQPLLEADQPDEGKVGSQIDLITAARGKLEKENALMMLAIRRNLTVDQWKKLQAVQEEHGNHTVHFRTGGPMPPGAVGGAVIMKGPDGDE